jgi:hypothetical protein
MVPPLKNTFSESGDLIGGNTNDSRHNPSNHLFTFKSYAQTVKSQKRDAFTMDATMQVSQDKLIPGGRHFLEARDKNSIVISATEFSGMTSRTKA